MPRGVPKKKAAEKAAQMQNLSQESTEKEPVLQKAKEVILARDVLCSGKYYAKGSVISPEDQNYSVLHKYKA